MKIDVSILILMLLAASFPSCILTSSSDNIEKMELDSSATLNDQINKNINRKVSDIISSVSQLPANETDSSSVLSQFIKSLQQFASNQVNISPQYLLFTPANPHEEFNLEFGQESLQNSTFDPSLETKFLIHGFLDDLPKSAMLFDIKDHLLQINDYNVIVVNWTMYNGFPYQQAAENAAFVGFEVAKLIHLLMDSKGIKPRSVHMIGHSLGGHSAGFAGKVLQDIGRITGLDAAGPIFQDLPSSLRLNDTDAEFVDAIHTDGAPNLFEGFGTLFPYGDIDFFPNGGSEQPNCSIGDSFYDVNNRLTNIDSFFAKINCNHHRVVQLFLESINEGKFESVHCASYEDFEDGKCPLETSVISRMGLYAAPVPSLPKHSSFFLKTTGNPPYCIQSSR